MRILVHVAMYVVVGVYIHMYAYLSRYIHYAHSFFFAAPRRSDEQMMQFLRHLDSKDHDLKGFIVKRLDSTHVWIDADDGVRRDLQEKIQLHLKKVRAEKPERAKKPAI